MGVFSIVAICACRKEKSLEALITATPCSYAPYTIGSSFTYQYVNSLGDASQYTLRVRKDTSIEGRPYSILNDGYNDQFIRCDNGRYFLYEQALSLPDYERTPGDRLFLHDDYPVGSTWSDTVLATVAGVKQLGLLQYHLLERDVSRRVMGITYNGVLVIRQDAAIIVGETTYSAGTIATYYYAPGVGYIETASATDTVRLVDYKVR